jgi:hypothetical protein
MLKVRLQFGGLILSRKNLIIIESIPLSHFPPGRRPKPLWAGGRMLAAASCLGEVATKTEVPPFWDDDGSDFPRPIYLFSLLFPNSDFQIPALSVLIAQS